MDERRRFVRLDTRLDVGYAVLPSGSVQPTVTKNVSGDGMCFFSQDVLPSGSQLRMTVQLPDRSRPFEFTAEVVWSELYEVIGKTQRERAVEVGVQFLDIAPSDREAIMRHVILNVKPPPPDQPAS